MGQRYSHNWLDRLPPWVFKWVLNLWLPFFGAGISVKKISADFMHIEVAMKLRWYNKNYLGTQFGGSIFSMTDPFYMLMLLKNLGKDYIVWDQKASVHFMKTGRTTLHASFDLTPKEMTEIKHHADTETKYLFDKKVKVLNDQGECIALVTKTLYVRKKDKNRKARASTSLSE